jgi:GNAT superfamily N-acetyltransferase
MEMDKENVIVRMAIYDDWEDFWNLVEKRGATDSFEQAHMRYTVMIENPNHLIIIAEIEEIIIGYAWAQDYGSHLRTGHKLSRFHDLFVLEQYRHRGAAARLFETVRSWAEKNGSSWLQWNANPNSTSFYKKLGYNPIPEEEEGFPFFEIAYNKN